MKKNTDQVEKSVKIIFVERATNKVLCEVRSTYTFKDKKTINDMRILKRVIETTFIEGKEIMNYARSYELKVKQTDEVIQQEEHPV